MRKIFAILATALVCTLSFAQKTKEKVRVENALIDIIANHSLTGDTDSTLKGLKELALKDSTNDAVFFFIGKCELSSGNKDAAEKALLKACELDPGNDFYAEQLAGLYGLMNKGKESSDIYLRLLQKSPGKYRNAFTLTLLADQQLYSYKDTLALENYEAALAYEPGYAPALVGKAEIFRMRGNLPAFFSAIHDFAIDKNIAPYPKCEYVRSILQRVDGNIFSTWSRQLDSLVGDCVKAHPTDSSALKLAGGWFYGTDRKELGAKYFADLLKYYPDNMEAHFTRLQLLAYDNDREAMIAECRDIIRYAGGDNKYILPALSSMGDCYYDLGKKEEAYSCYEKVLKADPEYLPVLNNYSYYLSLDRKKLSKAQKMSAITVEKEPDNPTYLDTYGWILHLRGKDKEAKPYFKHAMLYGGKDNAEVLFHYSEVLKALGETDLSDYYRDLYEKKK